MVGVFPESGEIPVGRERPDAGSVGICSLRGPRLDACNQGYSGRSNGCAPNRMSILRQYVDMGRKVLR